MSKKILNQLMHIVVEISIFQQTISLSDLHTTIMNRTYWAHFLKILKTGLSSLAVPGVPWHTHILADQLTLFQPGGTDYAHLITTGTPRFSDFWTALK